MSNYRTQIEALLEAQNHLIAHQNAAIDLLASDKRVALASDIALVAELAKNGELLDIMDYGDQIAVAWSDGSNNYTPALNLCHESDEKLEDEETIHGVFFEWDKTTPTGVPFDEPEAIAYFDGTESAGDHYIGIGKSYYGWDTSKHIQITLSEAPAEGDQLVISLETDRATDPTNGRTWNVYGKGSTVSKQSGTTSNGTSGTSLGSTDSTSTMKPNGKINAPERAVYGYNRWSQSALRQWLNSVAAAGAWWTAQNDWDRPPAVAATLRGFLAGYDEAVYRHFKPIKVVTVACDGDANAEDVTYDRVFLSSLEQMYCVPQFSGKEGEYWEYYKRLLGRTTPAPLYQTYARLIKYAVNATTSAQYCWGRSALRYYACAEFSTAASGAVDGTYAYYAVRCAPSVFLSE